MLILELETCLSVWLLLLLLLSSPSSLTSTKAYVCYIADICYITITLPLHMLHYLLPF